MALLSFLAVCNGIGQGEQSASSESNSEFRLGARGIAGAKDND